MSCSGNCGQRIQTVVFTRQFPFDGSLRDAVKKYHETVVSGFRKRPSIIPAPAEPFLFTPASSVNDSFQGSITDIYNKPAISRYRSYKMMKLRFDGRNIGKDIGMIELQIVQYSRFGTIMNKFASFIEKSRVIFISFDDKKGRIRVPPQTG